mmetsp:Transcript_15838/g.13455  ORF Transcript_15838/g.13455 Transcript_15838/m.13455 type:complete len:87 (+) Transcript_15838:764-1024(+)
MEDKKTNGFFLEHILSNDVRTFWEAQKGLTDHEENFSEDFKELFEQMTRKEVRDRATIDDIKNSKWYNGPTYDSKTLQEIMEPIKL